MNNIMSMIGMILGGIVAGYLVNILQKKFFAKAKETVIASIPEEDKKQLLDLYNKGLVTLDQVKKAGIDIVKELGIKLPESFSGAKLVDGMVNITSKVGWAKDIQSIFNLRKLAIVGVIISVVYGVGWFMGIRNKPVLVNLEGKEATIKLNEHFLKIDKIGNTYVVDKEGKILKTIKVKDIPELEKALRPYGIDIKYFICTGGSIGNKGKWEAGAGIQTLKYYKWNINHFITSAGAYPIGLGYKITDNFDMIAGAGLGYNLINGEVDKRYFLGGKWKF